MRAGFDPSNYKSLAWETLGSVVEEIDQVHRLLPRNEILEDPCNAPSSVKLTAEGPAKFETARADSTANPNLEPRVWLGTGYHQPECRICITSPSCTM
jgi:hypothetical protein